MADKSSKATKNDKARTAPPIDINQAVNRTITLPSALKPAKPPKGSKWRNRPDPSTEPPEKE